MQNYNVDKRVDGDSLRVIAAEFTLDMADGTNQEMEMFVPHGLLLIPRSHGYGIYMPKITFHSTIGDFTIGGRNSGAYNCPW